MTLAAVNRHFAISLAPLSPTNLISSVKCALLESYELNAMQIVRTNKNC